MVPVADHVARFALNIVRSTRVRSGEDGIQPIVSDYLSWGAGPRASQFLVLAAKAKAILEGSNHVMPDHIRAVALPVLRHRIITNFNAEADGVSSDDIINELLVSVPVDDASPGDEHRLNTVVK